MGVYDKRKSVYNKQASVYRDMLSPKKEAKKLNDANTKAYNRALIAELTKLMDKGV